MENEREIMKELEVTDEIKGLFKNGQSAEKCRDVAIKLCFATKRSITFGVIAIECFHEAWALVKELHPKESIGFLTYNYESEKVEVKQAESESE